jgi:Fe-S cluster assembly scaffold protein SufB
MMAYKEFVDDAIQNYKALEIEPNPIYKKYTINIPFDEPTLQDSSAIASKENWIEEFSHEMSEKTRIRFDAVISGGSARSLNPKLRISTQDQVDIRALESKMFKSGDDKLAAFSNAHSGHFIYVDVAEGEASKFNILFVNGGNLHVQIIVNAKRGSRLELFELFASGTDSKSIVTALHEISSGENSNIEVNVLHNEGRSVNVVNLCKAVVKDDAKLRANFIYSGGTMVKTRCTADSAGLGSEVDVCEFAFGINEQKFDLGAFIENTQPKSTARLESGAVLTGKSQCMLKGFAKVHKGAKGCVSKITERGLLLSKDAHIDALPDMQIDYSNEVKATHSASTSPMDKEALFYLESRGLEEKAAEKIFITSFIAKYMSKIKDGMASEVAMSIMLDKLEHGSLGTMPDITTSGIWMAK